MTTRRDVLHAGGGALLQPLAAWAQPVGPVRRIGVLSPGAAATEAASPWRAVFFEMLQRAGFEPGRNLAVEVRYAEGQVERLPELAQELVQLKVELIAAVQNDAVAAARHATRSVPIVMLFGTEPVELGFVDSLARPGGNVTGTVWISSEIAGKDLEVLKDALPRATRVAILANTAAPGIERYSAEAKRAASALGITLLGFAAVRPQEIAPALERIAASAPDALYVVTDSVIETRLSEIAAFALAHKLPTLGTGIRLVEAGGLLYYGADIREILARSVSYIDRILRGAKPADLPVETPTRFELVVNMKTAKALGITLPPSILVRASRVIE